MSTLFAVLRQKKKKWRQSYQKWVFNFSLHPLMQSQRARVLSDAQEALLDKQHYEAQNICQNSEDPTVRQGFELKQALCAEFLNSRQSESSERVLIHIPSPQFSPAGYSLFTNFAECLQFMGTPIATLGWGENATSVIEQFEPTILLTSEHESYLNQFNWKDIEKYKSSKRLKIGITAPLLENDSAINLEKVVWSKEHGVDFFYSFRDAEYIQNQEIYKNLTREGFPILCMPWGANILRYYPVGGMKRDLNYVLIASRKREHISYLHEITKNYPGFIDGPGWNHIKDFSFNRDRDRYIYSRAKIGLNIHLPEQLNTVHELNERTYQLAACGVPQLIDHPKLLDKTFSKNAVFVAENPRQYYQLFTELLHNPKLGEQSALIAQREVFANHTTFHRAQTFLDQIAML